MAPLVHFKKSSYLFPFIAIARHTSLQLISLWISKLCKICSWAIIDREWNRFFCPPSQRSCGRGILDYPSSVHQSISQKIVYRKIPTKSLSSRMDGGWSDIPLPQRSCDEGQKLFGIHFSLKLGRSKWNLFCSVQMVEYCSDYGNFQYCRIRYCNCTVVQKWTM